jgi:hypothetical protein
MPPASTHNCKGLQCRPNEKFLQRVLCTAPGWPQDKLKFY